MSRNKKRGLDIKGKRQKVNKIGHSKRRTLENKENKEIHNCLKTSSKSIESMNKMTATIEEVILNSEKKYNTSNQIDLKEFNNSDDILQKNHNIALTNIEVEENYIGLMEKICQYCQSKNFLSEKTSDGKFTYCCHKGKIELEPLNFYPPFLKKLITNTHKLSKNFLNYIRSYNSSLAFASFGAQFPPQFKTGIYCFKIQGQIYHKPTPLHPSDGESPKYAQLYIFDADEALDRRMDNPANSKCSRDLMKLLENFIRTNNPYAKAFKMMHEFEIEEETNARKEGRPINEIFMSIHHDKRNDQRRYNASRVNEVAFIFQNADGEPPFDRDIRIYSKNSDKIKQISILDPNCDPMCYPILFPYGDRGCDRLSAKPCVTLLQFYGHRFAIRDNFNPLLNAGKLTQQFIVDAYVKVEANNLNFIRKNQPQLRVDQYKGLMDHLESNARKEGLKAGRAIILPSSFQGSPRAMHENYQDAMSIVRKFGKPDLFLTMTCNPKWKEIQENLQYSQNSQFRPDIIARVFNIKLKELMKDLKENHILGKILAYFYVIEFQKRGLPHAHILIILQDSDKPRSIELIDKIVCAEIPDIKANPRLHEIISKTMIHGPCDDSNKHFPCKESNDCSKGFPKNFVNETIANLDGYPRYRRRENGTTLKYGNRKIDNRWIVPYNPYLSMKYNCHLNVEVCASIKSVKYLFKYVYKGYDCANIEFKQKVENGNTEYNRDEIRGYLDSRYVSAPEAIWRLFEFKMHDRSHSIIRLAVHLPNEQLVFFRDGEELLALEKANTKHTTLTAWFELNAHSSLAHQYLYTEIPYHYFFKNNSWRPRLRILKTISRMYTVSIIDPERYYLRLLLLNIRGATSFESLKTVDGQICETFKEAATRRHLLADDNEWDRAMQESSLMDMPYQMRQLFAFICIFGNLRSPKLIWEKYQKQMIEDFLRKDNQIISQNKALLDIQEILSLHGRKCEDFGISTPVETHHISEYNFNPILEQIKGERHLRMLNNEQKTFYDKIMLAIDNEHLTDKYFFLDGPGGSGKTFLYNTIISVIRGRGQVVIPVASTGVASTLLSGGRTSHSQFKLPVPLLENSTSWMKTSSKEAQVLKIAKLVIWDESTMASSHALNAVDRLLREIMNSHQPFGGKVILLGGDFRQCLPVLKHGGRVGIVQSSIKRCPLWSYFSKNILQLKQNMRTSSGEKHFADWLIKLGNGDLRTYDHLGSETIEIPYDFITDKSLVDTFYGDRIALKDVHEFSNKAILCPKNDDALSINDEIINRLEGELITYYSIDSIESDDVQEITNYPIEFLNSLTPSGLPPHKLNLKVGAVIMLLRNLNTKKGLCNGTRLIIQTMKQNIIKAEILTGSSIGYNVLIPRIDLIPSDGDLPFKIRRRQFPIRCSFAMTINKAQGQTFDEVGIYLSSPVFSHGQLYVAFSRAKSRKNVKIRILDTDKQGKAMPKSNRVFTSNIVYKEIFESPKNNLLEYHTNNLQIFLDNLAKDNKDPPDLNKNDEKETKQNIEKLNISPLDCFKNMKFCPESTKNVKEFSQNLIESSHITQHIPYEHKSQISNEINYESASNKTQSMDITFLRNNETFELRLIHKCENALDFLIKNKAYHHWSSLTQIWNNTASIQFNILGEEVCNYVSNFDQLYYNVNQVFIRESSIYTSNLDNFPWINQQYFPLKTCDDGNCCYNSVALAVTGNQQLMPCFRFAALTKLIQYHEEFKTKIMSKVRRKYSYSTPEYYESDYYECILEDYAFSIGLIPSRYPTIRNGKLRIDYPYQYKDIDCSNNIHWGGPAQFYLMSIALNRPIHVIGYNITDLSNRYVWSSAAEIRPQITINYYSSHFVCMLPKFPTSETYGLFRVPFNYIYQEEENERPLTSEKYRNIFVITDTEFPNDLIDVDI